MEVRSENTPMGRVLLLTSRNLRLVAFAVRILGQKERSLILKKLKSSSSSSITKHTALGYCPLQRSENLPKAFWASFKIGAWWICWRSFLYHPLHRPSTCPPL